jgi:hypothetical protein
MPLLLVIVAIVTISSFSRRSRLIRALLNKIVNLMLKETLRVLILSAYRFFRARLLLRATYSIKILG